MGLYVTAVAVYFWAMTAHSASTCASAKGLSIIYWVYGTSVLWEKPMEKVLVSSTKISKKVGVPSVEGRKKVHVPYNYTTFTLRQRRNMQS